MHQILWSILDLTVSTSKVENVLGEIASIVTIAKIPDEEAVSSI